MWTEPKKQGRSTDMAQKQDAESAKTLALNHLALPEELEKLSRHEDWVIRSFVAENLNTAPHVLERLSRDHHKEVRRAVAINPKTSPSILEDLFRDPYACFGVAQNAHASPEMLGRLAEKNNQLCRLVATNPSCPVGLLVRLSEHKEEDIRCEVGDNNATPVDILYVLYSDKKRSVRRAAIHNLKRRGIKRKRKKK